MAYWGTIYSNPCKKDCKDRSSTCHSTCKKYILWKKKYGEVKEIEKKQHKLDYLLKKYFK